MEEFIFNRVKDEELESYVEKANVFNMTEDEIKKEVVFLSSFEDETLGSAREKLDVAVFSNGVWRWLDIEDKIAGYNEIPINYLIENEEYTRVLVLIRRMSSMLLDSKKDGYNAYIMCKIGEDFKNVDLENDKALLGLLAKSRIFLDESLDSVKAQIQSKIVDENERICSRLFTN